MPSLRRLHAALLLAVLLGTGGPGAAAATLAGPGGAVCRDFVTLYDNQVPAHDFLSWAQGYIAAANVAYGQHVSVDSTALETWLVDYCRSRSSHDYATAVLEFLRAHVR